MRSDQRAPYPLWNNDNWYTYNSPSMAVDTPSTALHSWGALSCSPVAVAPTPPPLLVLPVERHSASATRVAWRRSTTASVTVHTSPTCTRAESDQHQRVDAR
jgi:hypothetical protein